MKETGSKRRMRSFIAGTLAFLLMFTTALSGFPAMQTNAAEGKTWYRMTAGSGNGNSHNYSSDADGNAAVLLHQTEKMTMGQKLSTTFELVGDVTHRVGFFYAYKDDSNWLYIGYNGNWYYEYPTDSGTSYPGISGLPAISTGDRVTISVTVDREVLVVDVNGVEKRLNDQVLSNMGEAFGTDSRFGFRNGTSGSTIRFTDVTCGGKAISGDWEFLAEHTGQQFETEVTEVHTVTGTVEDTEGNPISDAKVRVGTENTRTDDSGEFSVDVEEGTYDVSASASGYIANSMTGVVVDGDKTLDPIVLQSKAAIKYDNYISNDQIKAAVSDKFPQVFQYELTMDGKTGQLFGGQESELSFIRIGAYDADSRAVVLKDIEPEMNNVKINADNAVYEMSLVNEDAAIDLDMTVKISVADNDLTWEVTEITKNEGCAKINTIDVPNLNLVTIVDTQMDAQFKGAVISSDTNGSGDREITFEKGFVAGNTDGYAYGFLSADGISAGVWSNSEMLKDKRLVRNNGTDCISLTSAAWYYDYNDESGYIFSNQPTVYEGVAGGVPVSELPCVKVCFAGDENEDEIVDWQDGAIAYRDIMNNPYGSENTKELVNYRISMNFSSQATNPYYKTADNIKKVYLATDGLPQAVMMKGYGSEGHDSANSEYGYISERLGGLEQLKQLNTIAHKYNTQMGIHINAQEVYPEAPTFSEELINGPTQPGWGWLDQSYTINRGYDLGTGLRYKRLLQLYDQLNDTSLYKNKWPNVAGQGTEEEEVVADAKTIADTVAEKKMTTTENLDFMYLDVWYGDAWETRKIAQQFNSLGWRFSTEFGAEGEYDSTWQHWATEGHYGGSGMKGVNSDVIRFIRNHQKDSFVLNYPKYGGTADNPLLGGFDLTGFEGWGGSNDSFVTYITKTFLANLPTKFLQHYKVYKWENYPEGESPTGNHEKEITLKSDDGKDTVVVTRNEDQIENDLNGDQTLNYVERTIALNGKTILDDAKYLLPWTDWETNEEKLYHFNYDGGTTTWELQDDWKNLANVKVYTLTDVGRTDEKTVAVKNGSITLEAAAKTPYIVVKGDSSKKKEIKEPWSQFAHVTDTGFNAYAGMGEGNSLDKSVWSGDTEDVKVVRIEATGNKYLKMGSETKTQSVSTTITDLEAGKDYVAQVYVDNKSDAKASIKVTGGKKEVSNYTLKSLAPNYVQCDAHSTRAVSGSRMQTMQVSFTAKSSTATLTLEREAGKDITYFDDIRIVEKTLDNVQSNGNFKQDFESVVSGLYPFVLGPAQGVTDHVTHLAELHEPYSQSGWGRETLDDVLDGKWSLKHHGDNNGIIYRTIPQNLHFEDGQTYRISFDYQSGFRGHYYIIVGDGDDIVQTFEYLPPTATADMNCTSETEQFTFRMVGSSSGQSWFGIAATAPNFTQEETDAGLASYGSRDFVMDNLVVNKVGVKVTGSASTVTTAETPIDLAVEFADELDAANAVTWTSSDSSIARVVPNPDDSKKCKVYFVNFGDAIITMHTRVGLEDVELPWAVSFPEFFDLPDDEQETAEWESVFANTEETAGENAQKENAIDGDAGTFWHSAYNPSKFTVSETNPAKITVKATEDISGLNRLRFTQRPSNVNGIVQKYKVVVGDTFDEASNEMTNPSFESEAITTTDPSAGKTETFILPASAAGQYVQIQVLQGGGDFACIAEITLDKTGTYNTDEEQGNLSDNDSAATNEVKKSLQTVVEKAEDVYKAGQGDYSDESWAAFEEAYNAAMDAGEDATLEELLELQQTLTKAQSELIITAEKAKKNLASAISSAKPIYTAGQGNYTDESWTTFEETYLAAEKAKDSTNERELVWFCRKLENAQKNLQTKSQEQLAIEKAQKDLLTVVNAADAKFKAGQGSYTAASWTAFVNAYNEARSGLDSEDKATLDRLNKALVQAQKNLITTAEQKAKEALQLAQKQLNSALNAAAVKIKAGRGSYTAKTWTAFVNAYNAANKGKNSTNAATLNQLKNTLVKAQAALQKETTQPVETLKEGATADIDGVRYTVIDAANKKAAAKGIKKTIQKVEIPATVTINNVTCTVTEISANAFKNYKKLKTVKIGSNVEMIGKSSFSGCRALKTLTIGENVKKIDKQSFYNCKKLNKITIKSTKITSIGRKAFKGTTSKVKVTLSKKQKKKSALKKKLQNAGISKKAKIK